MKSKNVSHISKSVNTSTRLAHFYPKQNKNKTKIFTLERNQQKLPHHKEQSIFGALKETSIKTVRRSRDRIKGSINHKIKAPFSGVFGEKIVWPFGPWALLTVCRQQVNSLRVHLQFVQHWNNRRTGVIYGIIKISIITLHFKMFTYFPLSEIQARKLT